MQVSFMLVRRMILISTRPITNLRYVAQMMVYGGVFGRYHSTGNSQRQSRTRS